MCKWCVLDDHENFAIFCLHCFIYFIIVYDDASSRCSHLRMETKVSKLWKGKGIAFLLLQVILIHCPHQFIDHKYTIPSRVKMKHKLMTDAYLMLRQLQNHLLRCYIAVLWCPIFSSLSIIFCINTINQLVILFFFFGCCCCSVLFLCQ